MPKSATNVSIPTKLLATALALASVVVVCGTAATVVVSAGVVAKKPHTNLPVPDWSRVARTTFRDKGATAALFDSLTAPMGSPGTADPTDLALMVALLERKVAIGDTASQWMPVFRRWARSAPLPSLWTFRAGLPGVETLLDLPALGYGDLRALFTINENAARAAFKNGQLQIAAERARENLAASRHFIEQPRMLDALVGRRFARQALTLLTQSAGKAGDTLTVAQARRLEAAAGSYDNAIVQWSRQEESDPGSTASETIAANTSLPPALRVEALLPIVVGGCRNTRELVFGFSYSRRDALNRAAASLADINRASELAALYVAQFEVFQQEPEALAQRIGMHETGAFAELGSFDWIIPPSVRARIVLCKLWGI